MRLFAIFLLAFLAIGCASGGQQRGAPPPQPSAEAVAWMDEFCAVQHDIALGMNTPPIAVPAGEDRLPDSARPTVVAYIQGADHTLEAAQTRFAELGPTAPPAAVELVAWYRENIPLTRAGFAKSLRVSRLPGTEGFTVGYQIAAVDIVTFGPPDQVADRFRDDPTLKSAGSRAPRCPK